MKANKPRKTKCRSAARKLNSLDGSGLKTAFWNQDKVGKFFLLTLSLGLQKFIFVPALSLITNQMRRSQEKVEQVAEEAVGCLGSPGNLANRSQHAGMAIVDLEQPRHVVLHRPQDLTSLIVVMASTIVIRLEASSSCRSEKIKRFAEAFPIDFFPFNTRSTTFMLALTEKCPAKQM